MLPVVTAINFGPTEWAIALALVVLLFGATKIPELARSLGKAKGEYQKAVKEGEHEYRTAASESERDPHAPADAEDEDEPKPADAPQ